MGIKWVTALSDPGLGGRGSSDPHCSKVGTGYGCEKQSPLDTGAIEYII